MALTDFLGQLRSTAQKIVGGNEVSTIKSATPQADLSLPTAHTLHRLTWLGPGSAVRVGSGALEIRDSLAYFHTGQLLPNESDPAAVNLKLPIASHAQQPIGRELPYWPSYEQLTPNQRLLYLGWLSHNRTYLPPELGYTFLFIYGLERRSLLERQDVKLIFKEIIRLRQLYERLSQQVSQSFDRYTSSFIWCLLLREPNALATRHFEFVAKSARTLRDDEMAHALAWLARSNQALPDWLAFKLAAQLPRSQRSVVTSRVGSELSALFSKRYREQFDHGLTLKAAKRERKYAYRPASSALPLVEVIGPDPMGLASQFNPLSEIWNGCIRDLKKLSTVVAGSAGGAMTVATWNAIPAELQAGVDHPLIDQFTKFIDEHTGDKPLTIVRARALATLVGVAADAKLTTAACRRMADTVANVGYCIEPDPRFTGRVYDSEESVVLFLNLDDGVVDQARYTVASIMLDVGVAIAGVDGHVDESEMSLLAQQIDSAFELTEHEQRRLSMLRALRIGHGADLSEVTKPLKRLPLSDRERVAKFALAMVAADGVVTSEEIKAVRRLYAALGFERAQANAALAALSATQIAQDEPVSVKPAVAGSPGEPIPRPLAVDAPQVLRLDRGAINAILKDTSEVARMLAVAMNVDAEAEIPQATATPNAATPDLATIDIPQTTAGEGSRLASQYVAFYQIIVKQPQWMRTELALIAQRHGLMLAGAVDAINDWSTDMNGGPMLYEDGEQFTLETAYLS